MISVKDACETAAVVVIQTPVRGVEVLVTRPLTPEEWRALAEWAAGRG